MIKGLTHDKRTGQPIQRLAVSIKVAIGLPPDAKEGRKAPVKLDHFIFLKKSATEQNKWEIEPQLTKHYGKNCREIEIVLLDDDVDNVFPTQLAWFNATQCLCFGDGEIATRRTKEHPEGQPWSPCGKECPQSISGECKPSGDLRFMLAAFPVLGSVARIHTSGVRSIVQVTSSIQQIQTITGGRLAGIRCNIVLRPEKTSYESKTDGKRHTTTIYAFNLEMKADGIKELVSKMTDHARLFEQTRKMLGTGRIEVVEDNDARAGEIAAEFYDVDVASPSAPTKFPDSDVTEVAEPMKQPNMDVMCQDCRQINGHANDCVHAKPAAPSNGKCPECKQEGGAHHKLCKLATAEPQPAQDSTPTAKSAETTAKPAEAPTEAPKGVEMALYAREVHELTKKIDEKKRPYLLIEVTDKDQFEWQLLVVSKKLYDRAKGLKGKTFRAEFTETKSKGKTICEMTALLEVVGEAPAQPVQEILDPDPSLFDKD